jgi:exonuclease III
MAVLNRLSSAPAIADILLTKDSPFESINITSYNMHGFNQGIHQLKSLCDVDRCDIIFIQEHWLSNDTISQFDYFNKDYYFFGVSAMESTLHSQILYGRPWGGVATLINKTLRGVIKCICCTERFTIITIGHLLLINLYLPSCKNATDRDVVNSIFCSIAEYISECDYRFGIIGGDYNCNVMDKSTISIQISNCLEKLGFVISNKFLANPLCIDHTFAVESRGAYSLIDHFFVSNCLSNPVVSLDVIHDVVNMSDHLPVKLVLNNSIVNVIERFEVTSCSTASHNNATTPINFNFDWSKADTRSFYDYTRTELRSLQSMLSGTTIDELKTCRPDLFTQSGINDIYRNVVHILLNASLIHVPLRVKPGVRKFWWNDDLSSAKIESVKIYKEWLVAGKPKVGIMADKKNAARKKYKYLIHGKKIEAKNRITHKFQDILISANKNKFWKVWKKAFNHSNKVQNIKINDLSDKADIANLLAANFQKTCTPNNNTFETEFKCKYQHNKNKYDNNVSNVIKLTLKMLTRLFIN